MLERFANVVYYFFISLGVLCAFIITYICYQDYKRLNRFDLMTDAFLIDIVICFVFFIIGWSIRYVITGRRSI
jgi:predicted PurR-regulated permease PerM